MTSHHVKLYRVWLSAILVLLAIDVRAAVLEGTVRSSSAPLASMTVAAYDAAGLETASGTTDSRGGYSITFPGGRIRLLAFDPAGAYATTFAGGADSYESSPELNVGAGDTVTTDFQMPLGGAIIGTALVSGTGAVGVTIAAYNLSGTRRAFTKTNAQGTYSLVVPSGSFKLVAYDDAGKLAPIFYSSKLSFGDATVVTVKAPAGAVADFTLAPAGLVGGTAIDRATNLGLPSISVYAYTISGYLVSSTTTNPSGAFRLALAAGTYRLAAGDPGGTYASAFGGDAQTFGNSKTFTVAAGQTAADTTIIMDRGGRVAGSVIDSAGRPVASARVTAYNLDGTPRTQQPGDANGSYALLLPPGSFKLAAWDDQSTFVPSFYQQRRDFAGATGVAVAAGQIANGLNFSLDKAARFTGTVTDSGTGSPLASMTIAAYDTNLTAVATAITDSTGRYRIGLPAAAYRLMAWDGGRTFANSFDGGVSSLEATAPRSVAVEETQTVPFTMRRGVLVSGKVMTTALVPVAGIEVAALDLTGNHVASGVSGADGSFAMALLPASYKLLATDPGRRFPPSYYDRAGSLGNAGIVVVPSSGLPAPLTIIVSAPSRRHVANH